MTNQVMKQVWNRAQYPVLDKFMLTHTNNHFRQHVAVSLPAKIFYLKVVLIFAATIFSFRIVRSI